MITSAEKKELVGFILDYMRLHNLNQKEMALKLNISAASLTSWIHDDGQGITQKNIDKIRFICREVIAINGDNNNVHSYNVGASENNPVEDFRIGLISAFIDSALPPESLKIALQLIKNFKLENKKQDNQ